MQGVTYQKLTEPTAEVAAAMTRWDNDPELVPLIRPCASAAQLTEQRPVTEETLRERLRTHESYLIYSDGRLVGEMSYQVDPIQCLRKVAGTAWIGINIGEKEARHKGIGRDALAYIESEIRLRGLKRIELGVFEFNEAARQLYEGAGYKEIGRFDDFTCWQGRMWQDIRMEKELEESKHPGAVDLYWIPLGAGGHFVRLNGKVYEMVKSLAARRPRSDLYHSALMVHLPEGRFSIESAWVSSKNAHERGVVAAGPVGSTWAGHLRILRYEVRCWLDGVIPDLAEAVESPQRLCQDEHRARRLLHLAPQVPTPAWGRDELKVGEMWNSNSVVSWLLSRSDVGVGAVRMPSGGRAPGWDAGLAVARLQPNKLIGQNAKS